MMRVSLIVLIFAASFASAQVPLRYRPLEKFSAVKLSAIYGYPEIAPTLLKKCASAGNRAVFGAGGAMFEDRTEDSVLSIWDIARGQVVREIALSGTAVTALALDPRGGKAVAGLARHKKSELADAVAWIDLETGAIQSTPLKIREYVSVFSFTADGKCLLACTDKGSAHLFSDGSDNPVRSIKVSDDQKEAAFIVDAAVLPGGKQAVLSVSGGGSKLWDLDKGKDLRTYGDNPERSYAVVLSSDGKRLATSTVDLEVDCWDVASAKHLVKWKQAEKNPLQLHTVALRFADDGHRLVSLAVGFDPVAGTVPMSLLGRFDVEERKEVWNLPGKHLGLVPLQIRKDDLVLGGGPNPFEIRRLADGSILSSRGGHKAAVIALAAAGKGGILSAGLDDAVLFWQQPGSSATSVKAHATGIATLLVDPNEKFFVTAGGGKTLKIWDVASGKQQQTLAGHTDNVTCLTHTPDGKIVSGSNDRTVKVWAPGSATELLSFSGHSDKINAVAVSPDGEWAVSASDDNSVRLWPLKRKRQPFENNELGGHERQVLCLAFSPDGKMLASAGQDRAIYVWDFIRKTKAKVLEGHRNWVTALAFRRDGRLVSASDDLTVRFWDVSAGKEKERIDFGEVGDCPKSLLVRDSELFIGTAAWAILRLELSK